MENRSALLLLGVALLGACYGLTTPPPLVSKTDEVKFIVGKTAPDKWQAVEFDDHQWTRAVHGAIGPLADLQGVMPGVWARTLFDIGPEYSSYQSITLRLTIDGSYAAFVNGVAMEVDPSGTSATLNTPPGLLKERGNVLAIEVHAKLGSSTVSVAPEIDGHKSAVADQTPHVVKGPYLAAPTGDSVGIEWETSKAVASVAIVDGKSYDGGAGTHHEVRATGLAPSHSYKYHVEVGDQKSDEADAATAAQPGERVRFVVYGDNRTDGEAHRRVIEGIDAEGPDFLINTGDLVAESSATEWQTFFDIEYSLIRHVPLFPTLGNHESDSGGDARFQQLFPIGDPAVFGGHIYGRDYGDVHVAALNSNGDLHAQAQWLESDLAAAEARGIKHLFVFLHWGPFSGGRMLLHGSNDDARSAVVPVARRHHVDAIFSGHDHFYERGDSNGLAYFVTGGGGAPIEACGAISETLIARATHHYLVVDVSGPTVQVTAKDLTGTAFDHLTIGQ